MSKNIVVVNQAPSYLTVDVLNEFVNHFEEIILVCGKEWRRDENLHSKVQIYRSFSYDRSTINSRILTWFLFTIHLSFLNVLKFKNHKILFYTNPPISYFSLLFTKRNYAIVVFDLYPDILRVLGIRDNSMIFILWKKLNCFFFSRSKKIITLSNGMKYAVSAYVESSHIEVVSVWPSIKNILVVPKDDNHFVSEHNLKGKFVVLYSGNMGIGHQLELLISVAELLLDYKDIIFLFVGEGAKKSLLFKLARTRNLTNVMFLPWQQESTLPLILSSADLAVVTLEIDASKASVPSKTFNYMAVGCPILGIGGIDSELKEIIQGNGIGFFSDGSNLNLIVKFILELKGNMKKKISMANKAREVVKITDKSLADKYVF
jgi:hypothetical protein